MDQKDEKSGKKKKNKGQEETPDTVIQIVLMAKQGYKEHEIYNVKFGTRSPFPLVLSCLKALQGSIFNQR